MLTTTFTRRELAHRVSDGIAVWLYWEQVGDTLALVVHDAKADHCFELGVRRDRAMDAFHHPYAYLAAHQARQQGEPLAA